MVWHRTLVLSVCCLAVLPWASSAQEPPVGPKPLKRPATDAPPTGRVVTVDMVLADIAPPPRGEAPPDLSEQPAERLKELEKQGRVTSQMRVRTSTLDQNQAMLQWGMQAPLATARNRIAGRDGPMTTSYSMHNTGTLLQITPIVEADGSVLLSIELEQSKLSPRADPPADANDLVPPRITNLRSRCLVRVQPGKAVLATGLDSTGKEDAVQTVLVATVQVGPPPGKAKD